MNFPWYMFAWTFGLFEYFPISVYVCMDIVFLILVYIECPVWITTFFIYRFSIIQQGVQTTWEQKPFGICSKDH